MKTFQNNRECKIVYIIPTLNYGGAEKQLIELCTRLRKDSFDVVIILLKDEDKLYKDVCQDTSNVRIRKLKNTGKYNILKLIELIRFLREEKPAIVHSFLPTANIWGCLAAKLCGCKKIIGSSRGIHHHAFNKWTLLNRISLAYLADHVVVNSQAVQENCISFLAIPSKNITKIPNGVIIKEFPLEYNRQQILSHFGLKKEGVPIITMVGRIDRLKGTHHVVKVAHILRKKGIKAHFVIAGKGPLEAEVKKSVKQLNLSNSITFLGEVSDMKRLFFITNYLMLPTLSEGCSNVILEAMAFGVPVVTTAIPGNTELIEHNKTGLLVPPQDSQALSDAVLMLLRNPEFAKDLGNNAQKEVMRRFNMNNMVKRYEDFYRAIIGRG